MVKLLVILVLVVSVGVALHPWAGHKDVAETNPRKIQIWVDQSNSICEAQRTKWLGYANLILQKVRPNDLVEVFEISDVTAGGSPLFTSPMPTLPPNATKSEEEGYAVQLAEFQAALQQALDKAFAGTRRDVLSTDIFSLFSRVHPDAAHDGKIFLLTDGLHVDPNTIKGKRINMENELSNLDISSLVRAVAQRFQLDGRTLSNTTVNLLLPDSSACPNLAKTDVLRIKDIYKVLVTATGGRLGVVETYLTGGEL